MVNDILPGQRIDSYFVLRKIKLRTSEKKKEPYLSLELGDSSGRIFGTLWDNIEKTTELLNEGDLVKVKAKVINWKNRPHLSINKIRLVTERDSVKLNDFIPKSQITAQQLLEQVYEYIDGIHDPQLVQLLNSIYRDEKLLVKIMRASGGKLWHHCYEGGLLEHSLNVARIVERTSALYSSIDKDLLLAGALLHDIGKIHELSPGPVIDYTDQGRLLGHIVIGYQMIASKMDALPDFDENKRNELLHLVLSHQGKPEQGSPVVPMSREAFLLYSADELDSKMNAFERIYAKEKKHDNRWSTFVKLLDRFLYFGEQKKIKNDMISIKKT